MSGAKRAADNAPASVKRQSSHTTLPGDYWAANPSLSYLTGLSLLDDTKVQMERLWKMLDSNGDGVLSAEDWVTAPGGGGKWELLRTKFDFTDDHVVSPPEFIEGLKSMALEQPLDPACFGKMPSNHHECVLWLNQSANRKIQDLCKELFDEMHRKDTEIYLFPETTKQMEQLWSILDANKDGVLSAEDWLFTPGGSSKWDTLRKNFDLDGSGGVEPAEFMSGLKTLALKEPLEAHCFHPAPTNHVEMMKCVNESTNRQIQNLCKTLYETIGTVQAR